MKPTHTLLFALGLATAACGQSAPEPWRMAAPATTLDLRAPTLPPQSVIAPARFVADPRPSTAPGDLWFMRGGGEGAQQPASFEAPPPLPPPAATTPVRPVVGPRNGWRRRVGADGCRDRAAPVVF